MSPPNTLASALDEFQIQIEPQSAEKLVDYCQLLWAANRHVNLTRHTDYRTFVARDVVDVVQLAACIQPDRDVLDIGSGGGVPGIVLSVLRSDLNVTLSESVAKKARLLDEFVTALQLPVAVMHDRAEQILQDLNFDCCVARAVGPLWKLCTWLRPHWSSVGRLLAVKGPSWREERAEAQRRGLLNKVELRQLVEYAMPATEAAGAQPKSVILELRAKRAPKN